MSKRLLALPLWFYAGWTLGALISYTTGVSGLLGPILGLAAAAIFVGDPRHRIWSRAARSAEPAATRLTASVRT
jgi:hypothetical protein